ncbi:ABC transporter ATP-binding protein [Eubacteriales bacterium OttesenSCG-928-M02]|nr:ABC transporter ATP-binding protein [Eubacteriales bacterium OttesenSCG-928-M02]
MLADKIIDLINLTKIYDGEPALNGVDLYVRRREFITLLGPSGCGKTTMLRLIAGFETADDGDILFDGVRINDVPPYRRQVNTVFQRYSLFPHLNVYDNVAFGLKIKKADRKAIAQKVGEMLELVSLSGYEKREVDSLSGGQQQRIAIARALVNEPQVLLLDEPLAALDLKLRKEMQVELKKMQQQLGITFIFVTHDQEEALTMSDTIVVMNKGEIVQVGTPQDIYNEPINAYVADFIGESNILDGIMIEDYRCSFLGQEFVNVDTGFRKNEGVEIVLRPEDLDIVSYDSGMLRGMVERIIFMGVHYEISIRIDGWEESLTVHSTDPVSEGERVGIDIEPDAIHVMRQSDMALATEEEWEEGAVNEA